MYLQPVKTKEIFFFLTVCVWCVSAREHAPALPRTDFSGNTGLHNSNLEIEIIQFKEGTWNWEYYLCI